jgi:5-methylcytosine-specific restriction protein A
MPTSPPLHQSTGWRSPRQRHAERNRDNRADGRIPYDTQRLRKLRKTFIAVNPLCALCDHIAQEVDHVVSHYDNDAPMFDWLNLQSLCKRCHNAQTAREMQGEYVRVCRAWEGSTRRLASDGSDAQPEMVSLAAWPAPTVRVTPSTARRRARGEEAGQSVRPRTCSRSGDGGLGRNPVLRLVPYPGPRPRSVRPAGTPSAAGTGGLCCPQCRSPLPASAWLWRTSDRLDQAMRHRCPDADPPRGCGRPCSGSP